VGVRAGLIAALPLVLALGTAEAQPAPGQPAAAPAAPGRGAFGRGGRGDAAPKLSRGPDLGYAYQLDPLKLPAGMEWAGHVSSVAIDSRGHIFVFHRSLPTTPELVEFTPDGTFVRGFDYRAARGHSILIDKQDNMWLTDQNGGSVTKMTRDGTVLMTIGTPGKQGDWDEQAGSRLLWQPMSVALAANGDIFIGMGHGGESAAGAAGLSRYGNTARVLHLTRDGKFVNQWISDPTRPGTFTMAHAILLDSSENIYIADREMDRIVIYDRSGKYLRTIDSGHLVCSMMPARDGNLWISTGRDGQLEKTDWNGKVIGHAGTGPGTGLGQFGEACDAAIDARGDIYVSDGVNGRVQKLVAPKGGP
jgi:hypothetical protein